MVVKTIEGVNAVNGSPLLNRPGIDVDVKFSTTSGQSPVAQTCGSINSLTQTAIESSYKLQTNTVSGGFLKNLSDFKAALEPADQNQAIDSLTNANDINTYLNDLETRQLPVLELVQNCLAERYTVDQGAVEVQKEATEESKSRLASIQNPERSVSYYEGWFPIFRPMQEGSLLALFGVAMAALVFSLGIFLKMSDIEFSVSFGSSSSSFFASLPELSSFIPYSAAGLLVGVIGATLIYRYA